MTLEQLKSADGEPFQQLFAIYAASILLSEQKPEHWLRAMVAAPEYRVWIAQDAGQMLGFSILFVPPGEGLRAARVHGGVGRGSAATGSAASRSGGPSSMR